MKWLKNVFSEIFDLFVDDASFALAILIWLVLVRSATPHLGISPAAAGILFFAGLALILAESTLRYARRRQLKK